MGLFDKKFCDVCGDKIGLLGNRKLEDGNICKNCAGRLSPWFTERKQSTLADINAQLAYREQNAQALASFCETRVVGTKWKIHIDDNQRLFFITDAGNWRSENPDLIRFDQITACNVDVREYVHTHTEPAPGGQPGGQPGPSGPGGQPGGQRPGMGAPGGQPGGQRPGMGAPGGQPGGQRPGMGAPGGQRPGMGAPGSQPGGQHPGMGAPGGQPGGPRPGMGAPGGQPGGQRPGMGAPGGAFQTFTYDFDVVLNVNCEWFNEISFRTNPYSVDGANPAQYDAASYEAETLRQTLLELAGS